MKAVVGACECVSENACRWVDVYISTVYSFTSSTLTSTPAVAPQSDGSSTIILSQKVYGELVILMSLVRTRA